MTLRCDSCGKPAADALGSRQCSLLDADDDPRIDVVARVDLRQGRILCPACARGVPLFEADPYDRCARRIAGTEPLPEPAAWDATDAEPCQWDRDRAESAVTAAESADAEGELDDEQRADAEETRCMMDGDVLWEQRVDFCPRGPRAR